MLQVSGLRKSYGVTEAIADLSFEVAGGEFVCVVGPSGCGKTTLLKCMSGLLAASAGQVLIDGRPIDGPPPEMALVFQEYGRSLFPWMDVGGNVGFPLRRRSTAPRERQRLVSESLEAVGLTEFKGHYPWQLSGGMQQRVAIARALAYQPQILLMDEPFASVDAQTRADLEDLLLGVWEKFKVTVVFVTHDIDESIYLADRVVVLGPRPTRVKDSVLIDLPRPRDQLATKDLPEFARLRSQVYKEVRREK